MSSWGSQIRTRAILPRIDRRRRVSERGWYEVGMSAPLRVLVVDEAADGKTGLRKLFVNTPSLVILDVTMPELDGYQTLERIRDLSDVPVLMLTARSQELEKVRGLSAGADDYVAKPFGRQELLARVQALLR